MTKQIYRRAKTEFKISFVSPNECYGTTWFKHEWNNFLGKDFHMYGFRILGIEFNWLSYKALTS